MFECFITWFSVDSDRQIRTVAEAFDAITPVDLLQQVR